MRPSSTTSARLASTSILSKPGALTIDEWKLVRDISAHRHAGILSAFRSPVMDLAAEISCPTTNTTLRGAGYPWLAGE